MAVETRYYLAEKVGSGTYQDPFRAKDFELYPPGSPATDFGDTSLMLVEVKAEPEGHDALAVTAVRLEAGKVLDVDALGATLGKAGLDASSWLAPGADVAQVVTTLKHEAHLANRAQGVVRGNV